jgi:hypothetical protein
LILDREPLSEFSSTPAGSSSLAGPRRHAFSRDTIARRCDSESVLLVGAGHGGVQAASLLADAARGRRALPGVDSRREHYAVALVWPG